MKEKYQIRNFLFLWLIFALTFTGSIIGVPLAQAANSGDLFKDTSSGARLDASDDPTIISERLVEIDFGLLQAQADGKQAINLNLSDVLSVPIIPDQVKSNGSGQLIWTGYVEDEELSEVTLVANDGVLVGNIRWADAYFQVRYVGDGVHAVREIDPSAFMDESDPIPVGDEDYASSSSTDAIAPDAAENDETGALSSADTAADSGARIDVLVVYTGAARAGAGGTTAMRNLITLAETETNTGYARSGVIQRVRVVHKAEVSYSEAGFNASQTLGRLRGTSDGYMDNVHALRNTYCADAVQLIANSPSFAGIGYLMTTVSNAFNTWAFSVVQRTYATGYYTFAHELGHNMGAHHDRYQTNSPGAYTYSHGYQHRSPLPDWRTIMAYDCPGGCPRLNNWSNPARTYNGHPMGVSYTASNSADNVRTLNNTRVTFANFRQECAVGGCSSVVTRLWPVNTVRPGEKARLWAEVRNTGSSALPAGARVGYYVSGPSGPNSIVGYTSVAGLAPGATSWRLFEWTVPGSHQPGSYSYWGRVYNGSTVCSPWKGPQNFTISAAQASAVVTSLWPVGTVEPGEKARLWAQVRNTGSSTLPAGARVGYYVSGPSGPNSIAGYTSVAGLAPGATSWRLFEWTVPGSHAPGTYNYWARVYNVTTPISPWKGPQNFTIVRPQATAVVTSLWPVGNINCGNPARLWAQVRNTGSSALPAGARVGYWVSGPSGPNNIVGYTSVAGLRPGVTEWRLFQWTVPTNFRSGTYSYWARVYNVTTPISPWKGPQNFGVVCTGCRSFSEQFSGGTAPMWRRDFGSWSVVSNAFYYTAGVNGRSSTSTYNQVCRNFDYRARLWRNGSQNTNANRLWVRASGSVDSTTGYRNGYLFQYTSSGTISVYRRVNGVATALRSWVSSSAVRRGSTWNELRVRAIGNVFWFYINGSLVWSGTDSTFSSGREGVGMFRGSSSTGNGFWVDYAILTALAGDADVPNETVSDEQQLLNDLADKNPIGNVDSAE